MRRYLLSIVSVITALLLTACGNNQLSNSKSSAAMVNLSSSAMNSSSSSVSSQNSASSLSALSAQELRPNVLPKAPSDLSPLQPPPI